MIPETSSVNLHAAASRHHHGVEKACAQTTEEKDPLETDLVAVQELPAKPPWTGCTLLIQHH